MEDEFKGMFEDEDFKIKCKAMFDKFDKDKNGYLDRSELKTFMLAFAQENPDLAGQKSEITENEIDEAMKSLDTNKDGKISPDEFRELAASTFIILSLSSENPEAKIQSFIQ